MKKKTIINTCIIIFAVSIIGIQFILPALMSNFEGTDDQAVGIINEIAPNYRPWAENFWEPSGEWGETILFAIQTTLGLAVIVVYLIRRKTRLKTSRC